MFDAIVMPHFPPVNKQAGAGGGKKLSPTKVGLEILNNTDNAFRRDGDLHKVPRRFHSRIREMIFYS